MKAFVFAFALLALVAAVTCGTVTSPDIEKHRKECVVESKVDEAKVIKIRKDKIFPDDEGVQKYIFCLMCKEGIVDAEGNLNKEAAMNTAASKEDMDKDAAAYDTCLNQKGTPVQKVYLMAKCYMGIRPDIDWV